MGIEPALSAWEHEGLLSNYTRIDSLSHLLDYRVDGSGRSSRESPWLSSRCILAHSRVYPELPQPRMVAWEAQCLSPAQ